MKSVVIVFALITLVWLLSAVFGVLEIAMFNRVIAGEEVSNAELIASDERIAVIGYLTWAVRLAGAIAFIAWMYRAYRNVDAVEPGGRRFDHGWAIGAWFVPFLAMWRPKQIINDIWRAGDASRAFVIGWLWWTLWLVMTPLYWFANSAYTSAQTPEAVRDASTALLVADVLGATAAVLAIVVVLQATRRLDRRAVARTRPPDPQWRIAPPVERREDEPFPAYPA